MTPQSKMKTFTMKMSGEDLDRLNELAESLGTTAPNLTRQIIRVHLAMSGMLDPVDAERVIKHHRIWFVADENVLNVMRFIRNAVEKTDKT